MFAAHLITENSENQLRQYADAAAVFHAHALAVKEAATVRGSMLWREIKGTRYLIRTSAAGAQHSLGPESVQTVAMFNSFMARKEQLAHRRTALGAKLEEMRKLNKVYRVGRTPQVVVTLLQVLEKSRYCRAVPHRRDTCPVRLRIRLWCPCGHRGTGYPRC